MNKNKLLYSSPEAEVLVVRFEENIMSDGSWKKSIKAGSSWDNTTEDYGLE